jgi:hypothetical protein
MRILNKKWFDQQVIELGETGSLDVTISFNLAAQAIIELLSNRNKPFKVYNLGAGVKRITTNTDICPCCKRKL